jgi:hypothetical protein
MKLKVDEPVISSLENKKLRVSSAGYPPMKSLFLAAAALAAALPARAAFEDAGFGARSAAMADAMSAVPDDIVSAPMNPATLGHLQRTEIETGIRRLFNTSAGATDLSGFVLGGGVPIRKPPMEGAFGILWAYDDVRDVSLDRSLSFVYATRNWREIGSAVLDAGVALKSLTRSGSAPGGRASKAAVDLGTLVRLSDDKTLGFSILNVNGPRMDLPGYPDRAPVIIKLGFSQLVKRLKVAMDVTQREASAGYRTTTSGAMGTEYSWSTAEFGAFGVRTGLTLGGLSRNWSLGGGWRRLGGRLDYAVRIPLSNGSRWGHNVSLSWRFGSWNPEAEYEKVLKSEITYRRDLARALEAAEVKQWKLAEELRALREEMEGLRRDVLSAAAGRGEAEQRLKDSERRIKLKEMEERHREAQERLKLMQADQERMRKMNRELSFREDWQTYQDLKAQGTSELVLTERLKQMLSEYKGSGVDLGEANVELQRLQAK